MVSDAAGTSGLIYPYLLDTVKDLEDWQDRIAWPVSMDTLNRQGVACLHDILRFWQTIDDPLERHIAIVAGPQIVGTWTALAEAAQVAQAAAENNADVPAVPPGYSWFLSDDATRLEAETRHTGPRGPQLNPPRFAWARRLARTRSWSSPLGAVTSLIAPQATAVTHNRLLIQHARESGQRIAFSHGDVMVAKARQRYRGPQTVDDYGLPERVARHLLPSVEGLKAPWSERLVRLFVGRMQPRFQQIVRDVLALRETTDLPKVVWSGTGGSYWTRLIATEVKRRGGQVHGHDHGGTTGVSQPAAATATLELMPATTFHVATPGWADLVRNGEAEALAAPVGGGRVDSSCGEPTFRAAFHDGKPPVGRPRVIFVGHPFRGFRQFHVADQPDPLYWDFQLRLVKMLAGMDIDLLCKPHPEGYLVGQRNPLEDLAPTSYKRFEEHVSDADIFVFDAPTSTTFLEALCTNRPVVFIDRCRYALNPAVEPHLKARCTVIDVTYDDRNRGWINEDALRDAILGAPATADPSFFRQLAAGS